MIEYKAKHEWVRRKRTKKLYTTGQSMVYLILFHERNYPKRDNHRKHDPSIPISLKQKNWGVRREGKNRKGQPKYVVLGLSVSRSFLETSELGNLVNLHKKS